jgi:hypothetical protein
MNKNDFTSEVNDLISKSFYNKLHKNPDYIEYPVFQKNQFCFDWLKNNLSKKALIKYLQKNPDWLEFI